MGSTFWGVEVLPGKKVPFVPGPDADRLHLSQATLGADATKGSRVVLLCTPSDGPAVRLCILREGLVESCSLDLVFGGYCEFSVEGPASLHLAGYFVPDFQEELEDEDSEEEDDDAGFLPPGFLPSNYRIPGGRGTEDGEDDEVFDDEDDDEDDDDDDEDEDEEDEEFGRPPPKSGVRIRDLSEDDDAPAAPAAKPASKAEAPLPGTGKRASADAAPTAKKQKTAAEPARAEAKPTRADAKPAQPQKQASKPDADKARPVAADNGAVRRFENGFEIHNMAPGKSGGQPAKPGMKVGVRYSGRLQANGKQFDSNVGKGKPLYFRLGVGEVIPGFDNGVVGMRVGEKRHLVIPPQMGYGREGVRGSIPPNSTLLFDIELVDLK